VTVDARHRLTLRIALGLCLCLAAGCSPSFYRREADKAAINIIQNEQAKALGRTGAFEIELPIDTLRRRLLLGQDLPRTGRASLGTDQLERIQNWPEKDYPPTGDEPGDTPTTQPGVIKLALVDALQVAASNTREYQTRKEDVYRAALDLDLENDAFRHTFAGAMEMTHKRDLTEGSTLRGNEYTSSIDWTKKFKTGAEITASIAIDLVKLLSPSRESSTGILADVSITIPLMKDAGWQIVTEPMTQAQRNVIYVLRTLERFRRTLAVRVATDYLSVLQQMDVVENEKNNYVRLLTGTRRVRRLSQAGRMPEIQVDQARQDALRARDRWIGARQLYAQRLDQFKITLGLPTDSLIELDRSELDRLAETAQHRMPGSPPDTSATTQPADADAPVDLDVPSRVGGGPLELPPEEAVLIALEYRLDLQTSVWRVADAQRRIVVAANALEMGLALTAGGVAGGSRSLGSATSPNARLRPEHGVYTFGLLLDLPLERTDEQNAYRDAYITLERAVRSVQELEDQIKLDIRNELRQLLRARESFQIQAKSVTVAQRRVESTALFLQAGRAEVRDVLEAQESLVSAQNALTAALVNYRVAELELQRDMGVLQINDEGLWHEYRPDDDNSE